MKKSLSSLGKILTKTQLQEINGGVVFCTFPQPFCNEDWCANSGGIWYACAGECLDAGLAHFPPC
ncbi:hypothetical protein [Spongiimicrobium salis]|uniref:hypothetical protein n=1 Tax=Spongiimicrobium salis TaxID=1667022 RepID=UPI00374D8A8C